MSAAPILHPVCSDVIACDYVACRVPWPCIHVCVRIISNHQHHTQWNMFSAVCVVLVVGTGSFVIHDTIERKYLRSKISQTSSVRTRPYGDAILENFTPFKAEFGKCQRFTLQLYGVLV